MASKLRLPAIGLGTFQAKGEELTAAITAAMEIGYRLIDTATVYENEKIIGDTLANLKYPREEYYLTSKVANNVETFEQTIAACNQSLEDLKTDYLDLYLIHWPGTKERDCEVWRAMEALYEEGKVKAIGVSNFEVPHLDDLLETAKIAPMMNQVEVTPFNQYWDLHEYCWNFDIAMTSYGQFMRGNNLDNPVLKKIAQKHGKTVQQVIIKWCLQRGIFTIPMSLNPEHLESNFNSRDFELSNIEMEKIADLNQDLKYYPHPEKR